MYYQHFIADLYNEKRGFGCMGLTLLCFFSTSMGGLFCVDFVTFISLISSLSNLYDTEGGTTLFQYYICSLRVYMQTLTLDGAWFLHCSVTAIMSMQRSDVHFWHL